MHTLTYTVYRSLFTLLSLIHNMTHHKQLNIGLFGFGVVGEGLYKVLQQTPSLSATIKKVCIKDPCKKRNAPDALIHHRKR